MPENDLLKRLLDAGMTFTAMTQARAEDLIRDLVRAGEVQAEQAQSVIDELLDRSRRNSERLIDAVRAEIRQQMASLGLATKNDVERLERRIAELDGFSIPFSAPTFNEFVVRGPRSAKSVLDSARSAGVIAGFPLDHYYSGHENDFLVCVTETNSREQIDELVSALAGIA